MLRHSLTRLASLALVPIALTFASVAPVLANEAYSSHPRLVISAGETQDWFDIRITNLENNQQMSYYLSGPGQQLFGGNAHTVKGSGNLAFGFKMPRAAQAGAWTIAFQGDKGDKFSGTFTAMAQTPNIELVAEASPDLESTGTILSFNSRSGTFNDGEPMSFWLTDPSGAIVQSGVVEATRKGQLDLSLLVSAEAARGAYTIMTYGWHSDVYGVAKITLG